MLPFIVLGLFAGASYTLASLGIVLTYKTTGIFNFAYGGVAMFCAFVFWQLRDQWGVSQWFSIPILLFIVAPILGLLLEAIMGSLAATTAEVQIVVSLGLLAFFTTIVPILFGDNHQLMSVFPAGHFNLTSDVTVTGSDAGTFVVAFVMAIGLYLLLQRTKFGTATRAVVDNKDLAGLIAVNARTVSRVAWVISTMFAAVAGVLLGTQEGLVTYVLPFLVIFSFAPAVLGRLTSLPLAFGGSIALGVIVNVMQKYGSTGNLAKVETALPYLSLFLLLVIYGRRLTEVKSSVRSLTGVRIAAGGSRAAVTGVVAFVLAMAVIPHAFGQSTIHSVAQAMAYALIALTVVILTGWTGQISLAQMSFAGVGGFVAGHVAGTSGGLFPLAVLVGILIAVPLSLLIGIPSLRLSGLFLALATMAFALLMDNLAFNDSSISGGSTGLTLTSAKIGPLSFASPTSQFYLCTTVFALAGFGTLWLRRGPVGRRLQMVRDSSQAASTLGVNLTITKLAVFASAAAVASLGGSLLAVTQETAVPSNFSFNQSLALLLVVVLGGRSLISGAVIAGAFDLVQLLPVPTAVDKYLPLGIAISVVMVAREPDGLPRVIQTQLKYCSAILYRLARLPGSPPRPPSGSTAAVIAERGLVGGHG
jgi:branched-chain amino acid transport system permease protein